MWERFSHPLNQIITFDIKTLQVDPNTCQLIVSVTCVTHLYMDRIWSCELMIFYYYFELSYLFKELKENPLAHVTNCV